jgi:thioredoxin:protein disulfide reductase
MTMSRWARGMLLLAAVAGALFGGSVRAATTEFLDPAEAFRGTARVQDAQAVEMRIDVAPRYHLYRERIALELEGGGAKLGKVDIPAGKVKFDSNLKKDVEMLDGAVALRAALTNVTGDFKLRVTYQGCADEGLCYPPQTAVVSGGVEGGKLVRVAWQGEEGSITAALPATSTPPAATSATETGRVQTALQSGNLATIAAVFLVAGLLLAFTPCVLPMVPILSSIIVGQGAPVSRWRGFTLALAYSLGMALVYTVFGVVAGLLGEGLAAALQNPWVLGAFALMLATLSLSMFGVFELQMPGFIQSRLSQTAQGLPGGKFVGVFVMGGLSALIVGPCVAAPLAGALVFISQTKDVVIGGLALFCLAMGMSVPLLLVGVSAGSLLPRAGAWMQGVKTFFGVLLLAVALWIVAPVLPGWALMVIIGAALLIAAVYLKLLDPLAHGAPGRHRFARGLALVLAVFGTTQVVGALSGGENPMQPLRHLARVGDANAAVSTPARDFRRVRNVAELDAALKTADRPVVLDFYADWCVSCKEMEHLTFRDPAVRARMSNALLLQADVTANSPEDKALLKRFGLFGPPGILFFDSDGKERLDARVIGYLPPQHFVASLTVAGL